MKAQIALHRLCWEAAPSGQLKDRLRFLKAYRDLNTPDQTAELFAINDILKGRNRQARHTHKGT